MVTAVLAAAQGADAATGGAFSSWVGSLFGGGASSNAEKAARALQGPVQSGPYDPQDVAYALELGGAAAVSRLKTAVELKDFMRPGPKTWPGPWTPELLANAAVFFAHGGTDGTVAKSEVKIQEAVASLLASSGVSGGWGTPTPASTGWGGTVPEPTVAPWGNPAPSSGSVAPIGATQAGLDGTQLVTAAFLALVVGGLAWLLIRRGG